MMENNFKNHKVSSFSQSEIRGQDKKQRKILIVDDEPDNIRMLAKTLTGDYKVIGATSGREALECVACEEIFDLILLDIVMPDMDGYEVLRRLKAEKKTRSIPVICVTIMGEDINEARGFELGAVDYIGRPFSPLTVNARMRAHLDLKHYRDHLESMVQERTAALDNSNRKLREEILERKRAEEQLRLKIARETEMEKQLRQAQNLESLGTLTSGIAHDFNNILFIILGYSQIAMDNVPRDSKPFKCLEQVIMAGKRGADLINQILTFGQGAGQETQIMRIQPVIREALKLVRGSLPPSIKIRQNIDEGCGPVMASITHIYQVIMNLLTNAYHAMRDSGGVLEVRLKEVNDSRPQSVGGQLHLRPDNKQQAIPLQRYAQLTVKDTGHGMDKTTMEKIFDPYFTTKKIGEGTGLGLSTVYGIVQEHQGAISIDSTPGHGTIFDIFLPVHKPAIRDQ